METLIKYTAVGSLEGCKIIASYALEESFKDSIKKEVNNLLSNNHKGEWVTKNPSPYGIWFIQSDSIGLAYIVLVKNDYSDRLVVSLLSYLKDLFTNQKPENLKNSSSESYTSIMANDMRKIYEKYNDTNS
ncbi:hypothetical protein SteCoe_34590 [Stentor coeruleus]|uniref:Longin domain-containing protein n=1 Tax=Stentor coeruleus TaxID=5963 RepID=A0A1R2AU72_9CILI|nr:hypothetical protein SteCoe_34590 [Stentor coeruleus]